MTKRKSSQPKAMRLLREPTIHFFIIGAALFLANQFIAGNPRTIIITPALRADLIRRFQDQRGGQVPSDVEVENELRTWKTDEALFREALREGLDRDDPAIRNLLILKMREQAALQVPVPEPSELELEQWFEQHRALYETPQIYEHEYATFPRTEPNAEQQRSKYERALKAGATPAALGLRTVAAKVARQRIENDLGAALAEQICKLPIGEWHSLQDDKNLVLVRMIRIEGGLPDRDVLRERLVMSWKAEMQGRAVERAAQSIAARYRFEEQAK
jgi:hypothetical protein